MDGNHAEVGGCGSVEKKISPLHTSETMTKILKRQLEIENMFAPAPPSHS